MSPKRMVVPAVVSAAAAALLCLQSLPATALTQPDADALSAYVLGQLGRTRGIASLPRCGDGTLAYALVSSSGMAVQAMSTDTAAVRATRDRLVPTGKVGTQVFVDRNTATLLPYGDNFLDLVVMHDLRDADLSTLSLAAVRKVLCPGGRAYVGRAAGEGGGLTLTAVQSWLGGASDAVATTNSYGTWAVITKGDMPGTDEWTHRFHGPDNNPASTDTVLKPPFILQYRAKPYNNNRYVSMVSSHGRVFFVYSAEEPQGTAGRWLAAFRVYNGEELWRRFYSNEGVSWQQSDQNYPGSYATIVAVGDTVYLAQKNMVIRLRGETGVPVDTIAIDTGTSYVKWMAVDNGRLYTLAGAHALDTMDTHYGTVLRARTIATGATAWTQSEAPGRINNRELGISAGRIFYYVKGSKVVCRDAGAGALIWENTTVPATLDSHFGGATAAYTFCVGGHDAMLCSPQGVYVCAAEDSLFIALSATNGTEMWRTVNQHNRAQHRVLTSGLLFGKNLASHTVTTVSNNQDVTSSYSGLDLGGGCGPISATPNYLFGNVGSLVDRISPLQRVTYRNYKADCSTPAIIVDGVALHPSSGCGCPTLHRGMIGNVPADTFTFGRSAVEAERLEKGLAWGRISSSLTPMATDWWTHRANLRRTGSLPLDVPASPHLMWKYTPARLFDTTRAWSTRTPTPDEEPTPSVTVGQYTFFAGSDGFVRCWNGSSLVWSYLTGGRICTTPTVTGGCVYVGSADGYAYCIDAADGDLVWRFRAAPVDRRINLYGYLSSIWPVTSGVLVNNGRAYFAAGSENNYGAHLYCVDAATGVLIWQNNSAGADGFAPSGYMAILGNTLWARSHDTRNFSFDLSTGATKAVPPEAVGKNVPNLRGPDIGIIDNRHLFYGGRLLFGDWRERGTYVRSIWYHFASLDASGVAQIPELQTSNWGSNVTPAWDATQFFSCLNGAWDLEAWPISSLNSAIDSIANIDVSSYQWWQSTALVPSWAADWNIKDSTKLAQWRVGRPNNDQWDFNAIALAQNAVVVARAFHSQWGGTAERWPWKLSFLNRQTGALIWETALPGIPAWQGLSIDRNGSVLVTMQTGEILCYGDQPVSVAMAEHSAPASRPVAGPAAAQAPTPDYAAAALRPTAQPTLAAAVGLRTLLLQEAPADVQAAMSTAACRAEGNAVSLYGPDAPPRYRPRSMRWEPQQACLAVAGVKASGSASVSKAGNTLDRNLATRWTPAAGGQALTYDLSSMREVAAVSMVWYAARSSTTGFAIETSLDGRSFGQVDAGVLTGRGTNTTLRSFVASQARYVRISLSVPAGAAAPSLYEVALHAEVTQQEALAR